MSDNFNELKIVWVFVGENAVHPCAVFSTREKAEAWISSKLVSGVLTAYELDKSVLGWATEREYFTPTKEFHSTPRFIANFSSAHAEHYHYSDGKSNEAD